MKKKRIHLGIRDSFHGVTGLWPHGLALLVLATLCPSGLALATAGPKSTLVDVTEEVGIDFVHDAGVDGRYLIQESMGPGSAFLDYDNDGDQDIYLINGHRHDPSHPDQALSQNQLYRQNPDGTFTNVTDESGLGDRGFGMGVAVGDVDNDGDRDVYVTNFGADQLYLNRGDGTFERVTERAGIDNERWGCSATFVDFNVDGFLDIVVVNYLRVEGEITCYDHSGRPEYCGPTSYSGDSDCLYRNNGDGTFSDVSRSSRIGLPQRPGLGVVAFDYNEDGYPDIYVANDRDDNTLWINQKDGTFSDEALILGVAVNRLGAQEASMGIALGDVTGDLRPDLFLTHLTGESNTLYRRHGDMGFEDATQSTGFERMEMLTYTGFGVGLVDLNLDMKLDLVIGNGRVKRAFGAYAEGANFWQPYGQQNMVFEGLGEGRFANVSALHPGFCGPAEATRGLAFADFDNDGDMDCLVNNCGGRARLYRNDMDRAGNWLSLSLFDPALKRIAVGARVVLSVGKMQQAAQVTPGFGYLCSHDDRVTFAVGQAHVADTARVYWPGGDVELFHDLPVNRHVTLAKGSGAAP